MSAKNISLEHKRFHSISKIVWILMGLFLSVQVVSATNYPNYDGALQQRGTTLTGTYDTVAGGIGMRGTTTASLNLTVPGNSVVAAYLYWSGIDAQVGGDDAVTFTVDAGTPQSLVADDTYGPSFWYNVDGAHYHYVYFEDVTALVQTGTHQYTVSDFDMPDPLLGLNYGFGLMVVYNDPTLTEAAIQIYDGLDSIYWNFSAPQDSPSDINCVTFTAHGTSTRVMDFSLFAAGVDNTASNRPNNLYYETGSGTPPTNILGTGTAITDPFSSADGLEWDTYSNRINIGATDTYACFQVESVASVDPNGASILWMMGGFSLRQETPTAVSLQNIAANDQSAAIPFAIGALLLVMFSVGTVYSRKRQVAK